MRALPGDLIKAVHVSDGLALTPGKDVANMDIYRNTMIGGGVIPLQEWLDAVKSTGFDGWYCPEIFSDRARAEDMATMAALTRQTIASLLY